MGRKARNYSVVGTRQPRLDGPQKATGRSLFTDDIRLPGMLHGKIVRSPLPRGKIRSIDVAKAEKLSGVHAILTHRDTQGIVVGPEQPLLCDRVVNYIGDEVAAVAAVDEDTAAEAAELIEVEYEPLPPLLSMEESMKPGAPVLHGEFFDDNFADSVEETIGDPDTGFAESDHIRVDEFTIHPTHNCFAEFHVAVADYSLPGKLSLWTPSQTAILFQKNLALTFGLSESDVRICCLNTGGAFSGRPALGPHHYLATILSRKSGRPVRIMAEQDEEFLICRAGGRNQYRFKTGVTKDGILKAIEIDLLHDCGAYVEMQWLLSLLTKLYIPALYKLENFRYRGRVVYTNNTPYYFHHGGGLVPLQFALGQQFTRIAEDIGVDPVELQIKNAVDKGYVRPGGTRYDSCGLKQCLKKVAAKSGWKKKYKKSRPYRGIGIGCGVMSSGGKGMYEHDTSAAFLKIAEDGKLSLFTGLPDMGQGSHTAMAMIAAETLGISTSDITVISGDTDISPFDIGAFSQRGTFTTGNAVKRASLDARKQLAKTAGATLGVKPSSLVFRNREVYPKGEPDKAVPFEDIVFDTLHCQEGRFVMGRGFYNSPTSQPAMAYSFGAQVAEVEVDPETGVVKIIKVTAAHDVGRAINPLAVEGQLDGQIFSGVSQILFEESLVEKGRILNPSRVGYKMPRAFELPEVERIIVETHDPHGPFGAKEVGEGPIVCTAQTIANAVSDAIGYPINEIPITPERVLRALRHKRTEEK
ncbi:MAG: molybdopterin-dependent oxidoreductase [Proteobacteria bacterium]|nr:molybdopterin-dependent oxidoreductase [Pseudomonadota bacterium]